MDIEKRKLKKAQNDMTARLQPLADRVVVRPVENEQKTKSGIYIPDTAKEKPQEGEIVAVGPGRLTDDGLRIAVDLKVGDRVLNGRAIAVTPASVTFSLTMFGISKTVTLELAEEGE